MKESQQLVRGAKQARAEAQRRRARRKGQITLAGIVLLALLIGVWAVRASTRPKPGVAYPNQGRDHISRGAPHPPYNSNPPTSGWHDPSPAPWGLYTNEIADEILVHNLEHGGIWISYRDPKDQEVIDQLAELIKRFPSKVIVTPRPKNDSRIAVAAWTRLLTLEQYDEEQILDFIKAHRNRGPERVPD
ncbi:MAG TPA: DUF3105 domain-containing protein [bacterium]|nr:DUF3105 domain-containing protein [bacterium]